MSKTAKDFLKMVTAKDTDLKNKNALITKENVGELVRRDMHRNRARRIREEKTWIDKKQYGRIPTGKAELTTREKKGKKKSAYRDRAKERREGTAKEFADEIHERAATMTAEQTQFLGGDEKLTHLVKGLDFQLLEKNKEALARKREEEAEAKQEEGGRPGAGDTAPASAAADGDSEAEDSDEGGDVESSALDRFLAREVDLDALRFSTGMGRRLAGWLRTEAAAMDPAASVAAMRPGRTVFALCADEFDEREDVAPVVIARDADEAGVLVSERGTALRESADILEQLQSVFAPGAAKRRAKRRRQVAAAAPAAKARRTGAGAAAADGSSAGEEAGTAPTAMADTERIFDDVDDDDDHITGRGGSASANGASPSADGAAAMPPPAQRPQSYFGASAVALSSGSGERVDVSAVLASARRLARAQEAAEARAKEGTAAGAAQARLRSQVDGYSEYMEGGSVHLDDLGAEVVDAEEETDAGGLAARRANLAAAAAARRAKALVQQGKRPVAPPASEGGGGSGGDDSDSEEELDRLVGE